jgi:hypothetical protein
MIARVGGITVTQQILFIQGGGAGAYQADRQLVLSLRSALETDYEVLYPKMPRERDPDYRNCKPRIGKEVVRLKNGAILVGHSVGASSLLKYLCEEKIENTVAGIFLIATPYWGGNGWRYRDTNASPCQTTLLRSFHVERQSSFTTAGTTTPCHLRTWSSMRENCHRQLFAPSTGVDIN